MRRTKRQALFHADLALSDLDTPGLKIENCKVDVWSGPEASPALISSSPAGPARERQVLLDVDGGLWVCPADRPLHPFLAEHRA